MYKRQAAGLVLASTRAVPTALAKQGFAFRFTDVREALADLINPDDGDSGITVGVGTGGNAAPPP